MAYRNTASFGKRQEYVAVAELLRRGFDVYMTLVDDQGIDCIIRLDKDRYLDIQIKARSKSTNKPYFFPQLKFIPRQNYFFILYTELNGNFWTIPSMKIKDLGTTLKTGNNAGTVSVTVPHLDSGVKVDKFASFKNEEGFKLLKSYRPKI